MKIKELAVALLAKLTNEELAALVDADDDGSIDDLVYDYLYPADKKRNPERYADVKD